MRREDQVRAGAFGVRQLVHCLEGTFDERFDEGPIIVQYPIPVDRNESPESLAKRVLFVEHQLYPFIIEAVAAGNIRLGADNTVIYGDGTTPTVIDLQLPDLKLP